VVTGPDCAVLHHERALDTDISGKPEEIEKQKYDLATYLVLERFLATSGAAVHVVGQADADRFNEHTQRQQAKFTVHPHFDFVARAAADRDGEPLRVIMSGDPFAVYIGDHGHRIVDSLMKESVKLRDRIAITLTGKNWDALAAKLLGAGYSVRHETWVEDYPATLAAHDVALCPYAVGVGTKGKVLQAMATGLLTIGSRLAFENVQATAGRDFTEYQEPEELAHLLAEIVADRKESERIAEAGANAVRKYHSPRQTGEAFWSYALSINGKIEIYPEKSFLEGMP
jgi:glycosyltransferase involved in cell wall biosynthesis